MLSALKSLPKYFSAAWPFVSDFQRDTTTSDRPNAPGNRANVAAPTGANPVVCLVSLNLKWRREIRLVDPDARSEVGACSEPWWTIVNYDLMAKNGEK
jgi:hypothetical protein